MQILVFPIVSSLLFILAGLALLFWSVVGKYFIRNLSKIPFKFFGVFWFLVALGVGLSSFYILDSLVVYATAVLMAVDAITFTFLPKAYLSRAFSFFNKEAKNTRFVYSLFLITVGFLLLSEVFENEAGFEILRNIFLF